MTPWTIFRTQGGYMLGELHSIGKKAHAPTLKRIRAQLDRVDLEHFAKRYKMSRAEKETMRMRMEWVKQQIDRNPNNFLSNVVSIGVSRW